MDKLKLCFCFCVIVLSFCACTVTKRHHRKGYHIEWMGSVSKSRVEKFTTKHETQADELTLEMNQHDEELAIPLLDENVDAFTKESVTPLISKNTLTLNSQDEKGSIETLINSEIENSSKGRIEKGKEDVPIFEPLNRTPEEYLWMALKSFIVSAVIIGIALLFILVIEIEAMSLGGILIYAFLVCGFISLIMVPLCLLMALFAYLFTL